MSLNKFGQLKRLQAASWKPRAERGTALFLAVFTMSLILGISFGINALLVNQVKILRGAGFSVLSFGAADAGIEKVFYDDAKGIDILAQCPDQTDLPPACSGTLSNGATFAIRVSAPGAGCPASTYCAKSTGSYRESLRAIRLGR